MLYKVQPSHAILSQDPKDPCTCVSTIGMDLCPMDIPERRSRQQKNSHGRHVPYSSVTWFEPESTGFSQSLWFKSMTIALSNSRAPWKRKTNYNNSSIYKVDKPYPYTVELPSPISFSSSSLLEEIYPLLTNLQPYYSILETCFY